MRLLPKADRRRRQDAGRHPWMRGPCRSPEFLQSSKGNVDRLVFHSSGRQEQERLAVGQGSVDRATQAGHGKNVARTDGRSTVVMRARLPV